MSSLKEYLSKKPLFYKNIDYEKMPRIFKEISSYFYLPPTIHIVGTNGKGSTGRYLALMLESQGFKVGHYTSPHILKFNERIYKNSNDISDNELEKLHEELFQIVEKYEKDLSYFEYTTLLGFLAFKDCDFVILEAGLGGEFDATNVVSKILSIITPISYDHQSFLGSSIKEIATTKTNSINNNAVIAPQEFDEVYGVLKAHQKKIGKKFVYVQKDIKNKNIDEYVKKYNLPEFLKQNLTTAYTALIEIGLNVDIKNLPKLNLQGRFEKISSNIIIDVGHNKAAAQTLAKSLGGQKVVLVYNAYKDKDYKGVLDTLKPIISDVELIDIYDDERENAKEDIKQYLDFLNIKYKEFTKCEKDKKYLVFGSFLVVQSFLEKTKIK